MSDSWLVWAPVTREVMARLAVTPGAWARVDGSRAGADVAVASRRAGASNAGEARRRREQEVGIGQDLRSRVVSCGVRRCTARNRGSGEGTGGVKVGRGGTPGS